MTALPSGVLWSREASEFTPSLPLGSASDLWDYGNPSSVSKNGMGIVPQGSSYLMSTTFSLLKKVCVCVCDMSSCGVARGFRENVGPHGDGVT